MGVAKHLPEIYGNFITADNPSLTAADANGRSSSTTSNPNPATQWPRWDPSRPVLLNLNQTGGTPYSVISQLGIPVTQFRGPGLQNEFTLADAYTWEGGRGGRCEFWKGMSRFVPQRV